MDLGKLLRSADGRAALDLVRPPTPPAETVPLLAPPARASPAIAASAFAHLLRAEATRRNPAATLRTLAEPADAPALDPDVAQAAERTLDEARRDFARYVALREPDATLRAAMAAHALLLARLDARDARLGQPEEPDDVADLLAMLALVPWDQMGGAAEADLGDDIILDGRLVLLKTSRRAPPDADAMRELVARLVLVRVERDVREVAIYAARHGRLWTWPAEPIVSHPAFPQLERWLLRQRAPAGPAKPPSWARQRASPGVGSAAIRRAGKAETKKPPRPPQDAPQARFRGEREPEPEEPAPPRRAPRPDWRKGSAWRRERGR
ncbi:MAG: hypothetical protein QOE90_3692 [Thermoplasmata archaeon]|jgi:hypothetical protein|nr:hypothetical protein [Thermoplasmata archaeon]